VFHRGLSLAGYGELAAAVPSPDDGPASVGYQQVLSGGMHSPFWGINSRRYPNSDIMIVETGQRARLGYINMSPMPHPMHLHGHFFQVVNPRLPRERWIYKDTVLVEPMQRLAVELTANNPGRWLHHCHNLYHMEAGMANVLAYQGPKAA
jgi:FtsP/CotA-like multicopper oxidase with cupredoxin domain